MAGKTRTSGPGIGRRRFVGGLGAGAALVAAPFVRGLKAQEAGEIAVGLAAPLTGVFAFAGVEGAEGGQHCIRRVNEKGGILGRKVRAVVADTGYRVASSVAIFNRITEENRVNLYFGDSTAFQKAINGEINRRGTILMAGASFSSEINDPSAYPFQYMPGPDYSQQMEMLLRYAADRKKGARIAIVHSDTEFGRDPIARSESATGLLGLELVERVVAAPGSIDVSAEVLKLRRARPDFTIFHGYVLAPIPEFLKQMRQAGVESQAMGTFYSSDLAIASQMGEAGDGYLGVNAYNYIGPDDARGEAIDYIRAINAGRYRTNSYLQSWLNVTLGLEAMKRCLEGNSEPNGKNLKTALNTIKDFDTGGVVGMPVSVPGNAIPTGRVFRYSLKGRRMEPASDWISL